jgi:two-component system NtrC family sensor kinase
MAGSGPESRFLHRARAVASSLSLRLFVSVAAVIAAAFAVYGWVNFRATSSEYERALYEGAERVADLIQKSTHYGMLTNRKEEVHHIIEAMARAPDVEGIRIYDKLGRIIFSADSTEIGTSVDLHAEACVTCHGSETPLRAVPAGAGVRMFRGRSGRIMGVIDAIENAPECARSGCHVSPAEQSVLGVLDVRMSMAKPDQRLALLRRRAITGAVAVTLLSGLVSALFIFRVVRRPVRRLIGGVDRVAAGDLDAEIPVESENEIGQLARAFNEMTRELRQARGELTRWSGQLEARLSERTAQLTRTQREVAHMDKTASLGKLAATVAHELNNPLAGILNYAKLTARTLKESRARLDEEAEIDGYLTLIEKEAERCGVIVRSLLTFARRSGAEMGPHPVNPIIQRALMLIRHHLDISDIRLETCFLAPDDPIVCDADQLQQALVALFVNAVEAMPHGGTLSVEAAAAEGGIRITVGDSGVGIPADAVEHIFEPFFSTKDRQEGVGLGLAVVHGIVQRHAGRIEVESEPGKGTRFHVMIPRRPPPSRGEAEDDGAAAPTGAGAA